VDSPVVWTAPLVPMLSSLDSPHVLHVVQASTQIAMAPCSVGTVHRAMCSPVMVPPSVWHVCLDNISSPWVSRCVCTVSLARTHL
jgi:hypothetical protein